MATQELATALTQSQSHLQGPRKQAEEYLKAAAKRPGFATAVVNVLLTPGLDVAVMQAAAVAFKNHVKYHWVPEEDNPFGEPLIPISPEEKAQIKTHLINLMLASTQTVQSQLSEALTIICKTDFPEQWQNLVPELVSKFGGGDYKVINGALQTANSIFKRYRNEYKSEELYRELKYVLDNFVGTSEGPKPFLDLFKQTSSLIESAPVGQDPAVLEQLFSCIYLICRVYFSLHSQELPEVFEDTMADWMERFHTFLNYENGALESSKSSSGVDEGSTLTRVKASICENINVYIEKNEEEFQPYLQTFAADVWQLLLKVGLQPDKDHLATSAIAFLTTVAKSVHHPLFGDDGTLKQICEGVIIPNLRIREDDEELFEMNHIEYIRRDMEGSDGDTRRRSACELVKALTEKFPEKATALCSQYISAMLAEFASNPSANWKLKDCAIYLVIALTVRGKTAAKGATSTNQLVNIGQFFQEHIVPELQSANMNASPVLKADCLKFVTVFRSQLPKETCIALFPSIVSLLAAESNVVHSYAATCIERMLALKEESSAAPNVGGANNSSNSSSRFQPQELIAFARPVLDGVFHAMNQPDSEENEYLAKCLMRVVGFFGGAQIGDDVAVECMKRCCTKLEKVCRNPTNTNFNHNMFESVSALIKFNQGAGSKGSNNLAQYEQFLFPIFQAVLVEDLEDFAPYVFQVLSQLIEQHSPPLPAVYTQIFPPLLNPVMWERTGNVPALVRLLEAYLGKQEVSSEQLQGVLGVFQKLVASKAHDHLGFYILNALVENLPFEPTLAPYLTSVWSLLCQRLQTSGTPKFTRHFLVFLSLFVHKHGAAAAETSLDALQKGLFAMLLQQVVAPTLPTVTGRTERKLCSVALTKLLCDSTSILSDQATWIKLLSLLVHYIEGGVEANGAVANGENEMGAGAGYYSAAFAQLYYARKVERDLLPEVADVRNYLAASLSNLSQKQPIAAVIAQHLPADCQTALRSYLTASNAALN